MKKFFICLAALCAASIFYSCEKEIEQEQINPDPQPTVSRTFTLSVPATKLATKALTLEGKNLNATWDEGDCVTGMYGGTKILLTPVNKGSETTTLTGEFDMENHPLSEGDEIELLFTGHDQNLLSTLNYNWQAGTLDDLAANYDFATATVSVESIDESAGTLTTTAADFENQQAIVQFTLKDSSGAPLTVSSLHISADSGKLVGCYSDDPQGPMYEDLVVGNSENNPIDSNHPGVVWVALRNESGAKDTYYLEATTGDGVYTYTKSGVSFENGKFYMIGVKMTKRNPSGWFLVGGCNGWNTTATEMTAVLGHEEWLVAENVNITPQENQDAGFKFFNNGTWKGGSASALHTQYEANGDGNITFANSTYDIYYNPTTNKFFMANAGEPWYYRTIYLMSDMVLSDLEYYLHIWPASGSGFQTTWPGIAGGTETISGIKYYKFRIAINEGDLAATSYDCIFHDANDVVRYDFRDGKFTPNDDDDVYYLSFSGNKYNKAIAEGNSHATYGDNTSNPMTQFTDPAKPQGESRWGVYVNDSSLKFMHWDNGTDLVYNGLEIGPETKLRFCFDWDGGHFYGLSAAGSVDPNVSFPVVHSSSAAQFDVPSLDGTYICDVYLNIFENTAKIVPLYNINAEITLYFGVPNPGSYVRYYTFNGRSMDWNDPNSGVMTDFETINNIKFYKAVLPATEFWDTNVALIVRSDGIADNQTYDFTTADWSGHKDEYYFLVDGKNLVQYPGRPDPIKISIDGDMSDWTYVPGDSKSSDVHMALKASYDDDYLYLYSKRSTYRASDLWGSSYLYFDFDMDNDATTGTLSEGSRSGLEAYMYLTLYTGTVDSPVIPESPSGSGTGASISNVYAKGVINEDSYEIELRIPRTNLPIVVGQTMKIYSWGSKDTNTRTVLLSIPE